jgi:phosphosulfolactate synthase
MVMDQGWPTSFVEGMLSDFGEYLDIVKLWDPCLLTPAAAVERRIAAYREADVIVQPGGIWLEMARKQGTGDKLLADLQSLGFNGLEVSNTASEQTDDTEDMIAAAKSLGYTVFGEIGRKFADGDETRLTEDVIDASVTIAQFRASLAAGAWKCYWEGHLLRRVLGDDPASINLRAHTGVSQVREVVSAVGVENIIFEASGLRPRANRQWLQFWLVRLFGPDVNIGNARIEELANLEAIRSGTHPIFGLGSSGNYAWLRAVGSADEAGWWRR